MAAPGVLTSHAKTGGMRGNAVAKKLKKRVNKVCSGGAPTKKRAPGGCRGARFAGSLNAVGPRQTGTLA
jgi:hypothetical protein